MNNYFILSAKGFIFILLGQRSNIRNWNIFCRMKLINSVFFFEMCAMYKTRKQRFMPSLNKQAVLIEKWSPENNVWSQKGGREFVNLICLGITKQSKKISPDFPKLHSAPLTVLK